VNSFIPQMRPMFGLEEKAELLSYLDDDGFFTEFKKTEFFERQIAEFTGAKHCVVVNNGTVSLTLAALEELGLLELGEKAVVVEVTQQLRLFL